jgi:serine/threonine protein phosphatase PrpC/ribosomal protein L39E
VVTAVARELKISLGQHSGKGRKDTNQDFHGALTPEEPLLSTKGIAVVLADGISSSSVSRIAAESAVKSFLTDYYCTSETWSVKTSAQRVIAAANSWLHSQTRRGQNPFDQDKGYVCTFDAVVLKARTAHIFHVGDSRVYRLDGASLEQLTEDHRVSVAAGQHYLSRALGVQRDIEIDYRTLPIDRGDILLLACDGVYEHADARFMAKTIKSHGDDLDAAAKAIVGHSYEQGSTDNLTLQIIRIDDVPDGNSGDVIGQAADLPLPPLLEPGMQFDGFRIVRELHGSSRSHLYLAVDTLTDGTCVIKIPSIDLGADKGYLKRLMMEEWIGRRINSPHVLKSLPPSGKRNFLYVVTEYVEGQTLAQWMIDNPQPDLETVRGIVEQVARGLQAFHRLEMVHQDLRPANIMIDRTGTVKIIDFGSTKVAGVVEARPSGHADEMLGTVQYTAPEYLLGDGGSPRGDLYSLGVITYHMLTGKLPYGADMARAKTRSRQKKVPYASAMDENRSIPVWVDGALRKAVHPDPFRRYEEISEFIHALRHPASEFLNPPTVPLMDRNPLLFWKGVSLVLALIIVGLLARR